MDSLLRAADLDEPSQPPIPDLRSISLGQLSDGGCDELVNGIASRFVNHRQVDVAMFDSAI